MTCYCYSITKLTVRYLTDLLLTKLCPSVHIVRPLVLNRTVDPYQPNNNPNSPSTRVLPCSLWWYDVRRLLLLSRISYPVGRRRALCSTACLNRRCRKTVFLEPRFGTRNFFHIANASFQIRYSYTLESIFLPRLYAIINDKWYK
jgi:hypothetical protein